MARHAMVARRDRRSPWWRRNVGVISCAFVLASCLVSATARKVHSYVPHVVGDALEVLVCSRKDV